MSFNYKAIPILFVLFLSFTHSVCAWDVYNKWYCNEERGPSIHLQDMSIFYDANSIGFFNISHLNDKYIDGGWGHFRVAVKVGSEWIERSYTRDDSLVDSSFMHHADLLGSSYEEMADWFWNGSKGVISVYGRNGKKLHSTSFTLNGLQAASNEKCWIKTEVQIVKEKQQQEIRQAEEKIKLAIEEERRIADLKELFSLIKNNWQIKKFKERSKSIGSRRCYKDETIDYNFSFDKLDPVKGILYGKSSYIIINGAIYDGNSVRNEKICNKWGTGYRDLDDTATQLIHSFKITNYDKLRKKFVMYRKSVSCDGQECDNYDYEDSERVMRIIDRSSLEYYAPKKRYIARRVK